MHASDKTNQKCNLNTHTHTHTYIQNSHISKYTGINIEKETSTYFVKKLYNFIKEYKIIFEQMREIYHQYKDVNSFIN